MGYYAGKPLESVNCFYEINFKIVSTSWVNRCFNRKAFDQSGRSSVSAIIQKGMYDCSFELNFQSDVTTLWTDFYVVISNRWITVIIEDQGANSRATGTYIGGLGSTRKYTWWTRERYSCYLRKVPLLRSFITHLCVSPYKVLLF